MPLTPRLLDNALYTCITNSNAVQNNTGNENVSVWGKSRASLPA